MTMMVTTQGADHTAGNLPRLKTREMDAETLMDPGASKQQIKVAANDSLGLCVFGQSVTNVNLEFLTDAITPLTANLTTGFRASSLWKHTLYYER